MSKSTYCAECEIDYEEVKTILPKPRTKPLEATLTKPKPKQIYVKYCGKELQDLDEEFKPNYVSKYGHLVRSCRGCESDMKSLRRPEPKQNIHKGIKSESFSFNC